MQRSNRRRAGRAISSKPQQGRDVSAINKLLGASLVLLQHPACYKAGGANCTAFTQPKQVLCQHLTPTPQCVRTMGTKPCCSALALPVYASSGSFCFSWVCLEDSDHSRRPAHNPVWDMGVLVEEPIVSI